MVDEDESQLFEIRMLKVNDLVNDIVIEVPFKNKIKKSQHFEL